VAASSVPHNHLSDAKIRRISETAKYFQENLASIYSVALVF
jgi:hypothetical protein